MVTNIFIWTTFNHFQQDFVSACDNSGNTRRYKIKAVENHSQIRRGKTKDFTKYTFDAYCITQNSLLHLRLKQRFLSFFFLYLSNFYFYFSLKYCYNFLFGPNFSSVFLYLPRFLIMFFFNFIALRIPLFNLFQANVSFLYPLKTLVNSIFLRFQGVWKWNIGEKRVKVLFMIFSLNFTVTILFVS